MRIPIVGQRGRARERDGWLRKQIDAGFYRAGGWTKIASGGIDWTKKTAAGAVLGVEVQVSARSDLLTIDLMHLRNRFASGEIDVGLIVVPDDALSKYLTDRTPNFRTAVKHVDHWAKDSPIRVLAFHHDGAGPPLDKMITNKGKPSN